MSVKKVGFIPTIIKIYEDWAYWNFINYAAQVFPFLTKSTKVLNSDSNFFILFVYKEVHLNWLIHLVFLPRILFALQSEILTHKKGPFYGLLVLYVYKLKRKLHIVLDLWLRHWFIPCIWITPEQAVIWRELPQIYLYISQFPQCQFKVLIILRGHLILHQRVIMSCIDSEIMLSIASIINI